MATSPSLRGVSLDFSDRMNVSWLKRSVIAPMTSVCKIQGNDEVIAPCNDDAMGWNWKPYHVAIAQDGLME